MAWCEGQQAVVYYCLGLAKNGILIERLALALADARARRCLSGAAQVRVFREFEYRTQTSWSCWRRVIGKAEVMAAGDNPRFVVTNLPAEGFKGQEDRLSTHYLASNQLRLWLATLGYLLLERLRMLGLAGTDLARATVGSVRLKPLKVAAQVRVSVRRVYVQLSSAYPLQALFRLGHRRLMRLAPVSGLSGVAEFPNRRVYQAPREKCLQNGPKSTGCETVEKYSLTYRVWDNGNWCKFNEPMPNPNLALF